MKAAKTARAPKVTTPATPVDAIQLYDEAHIMVDVGARRMLKMLALTHRYPETAEAFESLIDSCFNGPISATRSKRT